MTLNIRYYRARPIDMPGYEYECLELPLEKTALVVMHCWNIGCPDGPAVDPNYCVGMGWQSATDEAYRMMSEVIRPTLDAARNAGITVCHVETDWMDEKYPDIKTRKKPSDQCKRAPRHKEMLDRAHGPEYMKDSPLADMRRAKIVEAIDDEPMFFYSDQLDMYLTEKAIDTLIYVGFAADMCILGSEGGGRPMLARDYRCILMRDATFGVESPETFPDRVATRYGIHIFEWSIGYSTTHEEFISALSG